MMSASAAPTTSERGGDRWFGHAWSHGPVSYCSGCGSRYGSADTWPICSGLRPPLNEITK
jgi:hypothetical protein